MTALNGSRSIASLVLNIGTRLRCVVSFTPRPLYPPRNSRFPTELDARWAPRAVWPFAIRQNLLPELAIELRFLATTAMLF
jgi:hypothetical protein